MTKTRLTKEQRIKRRKRTRRKLIGLIFLFLAVVGTVSIISAVVAKIGLLLDDSDEYLEYENLFAQLVSLDPIAFDSIEQADKNVLKQAAIETTLAFEDTDKYERTADTGQIILPVVDIERYATKLYGPNYYLEHGTFGQTSLILGDLEDTSGYIFLPEKNAYIIPPLSAAGSYIPKIVEIQRSGNTKTLKIAYMQVDTSLFSVVNDPDSQIVVKYMDYVLIKESGQYYLYSIRTSSDKEE
jgi:hypothetical protein